MWREVKHESTVSWYKRILKILFQACCFVILGRIIMKMVALGWEFVHLYGEILFKLTYVINFLLEATKDEETFFDTHCIHMHILSQSASQRKGMKKNPQYII